MLICLCLFDVINELHVMDERMLNEFLIGKWILYVIKACLIHDVYLVYLVETCITSNK